MHWYLLNMTLTNFLPHATKNQQIKVNTLIENETVLLNQSQMGGFFQKSKAIISKRNSKGSKK